jgi:hypothetical protein
MPLEIYTLIVAILATISLIWWVLSEVFNVFEKRRGNVLRQIIKEQQKEIDRLKHENLQYYGRFGVLTKDSEK